MVCLCRRAPTVSSLRWKRWLSPDIALKEADAFDLTFARAHVYLTRSAIYTGLGRYADAFALLSAVETVARQTADAYLQMNERALRCRAHLLIRDVASAAAAVDSPFTQLTSSGQYSEILSLRALIRGMTGDTREAIHLLEEAREVSRENEAIALNSCVAALLELDRENISSTFLATAFSEYSSKGILDPFVLTFRLEPRLAQALNRVPALRQQLWEVLGPDARGGAAQGFLRRSVPRLSHRANERSLY